MNGSNGSPEAETPKPGIDLEAIARRMMELADLSVREHLQAVARSQADALLELSRLPSGSEFPIDRSFDTLGLN